MTAILTDQNGTRTARVKRPAEIREDDRTSKFRFTDKHGNPGETFLGADLFDLFNVPGVFFQQFKEQFSDELPKVVNAVKEWAKKWNGHIEGWELYPREGASQNFVYFQCVVTQKGEEYDQKLAEALTLLDGHLYNDLGCSLIRVTVLMVPNVSEEEVRNIWA